VAALALRRRRPADLAAEIGRSRPAISRQLNLLREAGLIEARRSMVDGRGLSYGISPARHGQITAWLLGTEIVRPSEAPAHESASQTAVVDQRDRDGSSV